MLTLIELIGAGVILATIAWWFLAHLRFWYVLRKEVPGIYKNHAKIGVGYTGGSKFLDFALSRKYRKAGNERVSKAGDFLVATYDKYPYSVAIIVLAVIAAGMIQVIET